MHRSDSRRQLCTHRRALRYQTDGRIPLLGSPSRRVGRGRGELAADGGAKVLVRVPRHGAQAGHDRPARALPHGLLSDLRRRRPVLCRSAADRKQLFRQEHQDRVADRRAAVGLQGDRVGEHKVALHEGVHLRNAEGENRGVPQERLRQDVLRLSQQTYVGQSGSFERVEGKGSVPRQLQPFQALLRRFGT